MEEKACTNTCTPERIDYAIGWGSFEVIVIKLSFPIASWLLW